MKSRRAGSPHGASARTKVRGSRHGPCSPPIRDTKTSRMQRTSTTVAMTGSGRMLNRATLAVGEVTAGPAVTSTDTLGGEATTIKEEPSIAAFARPEAPPLRDASGTQTVAARQIPTSVRERLAESVWSVGTVPTIAPIIPRNGPEAREGSTTAHSGVHPVCSGENAPGDVILCAAKNLLTCQDASLRSA